MKKIVKILVSAVLFAALVCTAALPAFAATSPIDASVSDCIDYVKLGSVRTLYGNVALSAMTVRSRINGTDNGSYATYSVYTAIPQGSYKLFSYSYGTNTDYKLHTVTDMMKQFEKDNPGWIPVVGINGDFFDTKGSSQSEGMCLQSGDLYKAYCNTLVGRGVLGFKSGGGYLYDTVGMTYIKYSTSVAVSSTTYLQVLDDEGKVASEHGVYLETRHVDENTMALFTPNMHVTDLTGYTVFVVDCSVFRCDDKTYWGNTTANKSYYVYGEIKEIRDGTTDELPGSGEVYLVCGDRTKYSELTVGTSLKCQKKLLNSWASVDNAIGYKQQVLMAGESLFKNVKTNYSPNGKDWSVYTEDASYSYAWKNRTVMGFREDGTPVICVIECGSIGASYYEIAEYMRAAGCRDAFVFDGGGSTALAVRNDDGSFSTVNKLSDGRERSVANAVILAVRDPSMPLPEETTAAPEETTVPEATSGTESGDVTAASGGCGSSWTCGAATVVALPVCVALTSKKRTKKRKNNTKNS